MRTIEAIDRALTDGLIDQSEYQARLAIILNAGAAHDAIERWYTSCTGGERAQPMRPLPFTTLPLDWSNLAFKLAADPIAQRYGANWYWSAAAYDKFEAEYERQCRALEVRHAVEEGLGDVPV